MHDIRFPNETPAYRAARDALLKEEVDLRRHVERVAAQRRQLPPGGFVPVDYLFDEAVPEDEGVERVQPVRMSELFDAGHDTLIVYSYMFGPNAERPCPMCTSILDSLDGAAPHVTQRAGLVAVARAPIDRVRAIALERGWRHLRLLSSAHTSYHPDYHGENARGDQLPACNVFVRRDGRIHHFWGSELLYMSADPGQDTRHVDMIWPLWNLLDLTPEGRGTTFFPKLSYETLALHP